MKTPVLVASFLCLGLAAVSVAQGVADAESPLARAKRLDSLLRRAQAVKSLFPVRPASQYRAPRFKLPNPKPMNEIVPGQLLVKTFPSEAARIASGFSGTQTVSPGKAIAQKILPEGKFLNRLAQSGWTLWEIPAVLDPKGFAEIVKERPGVLSVQPVNKIYPLLGAPNDPDWNYIETSENLILNFGENQVDFRRMWPMTDVFAMEGWNKWPNRYFTAANKPANAPLVAVIDTGLDMEHPDFRNAGGTTSNVTGGGQIDHAKSKQFRFGAIDNAGSPNDTNGHGTHVAGIALASANNGGYLGRGTVGTGYNAKGMVLRVFDDTGNGSDADAAAAIFYAADQGADVINLSLGTRNFSQTFQDAVTYAWQKGTLVVCAANEDGNGGGDLGPIYPAACSGALAVTANGPDWGSAASTYAGAGSYVDLAAPGGDVIQSTDYYILQWVYSTSPRDFVYLNTPGITFPQFEQVYAYLLGTSMACPHVAGAAAVYLDMHNLRQGSGWSNVKAYQALQRSAFPVAMAPNGGWEAVQGYGNLDMELLLDPWDTNARTATVGSVEGIVYYNGTAVSNVQVRAQALTGGTIYTTSTQSDGTYRFDQLPSGSSTPTVYRIECSPFGNLRAKNTPIVVGSDMTGFDFWVNGLVTDEDGNVVVYNADNTPPVIQWFEVKHVRGNTLTFSHFGYDTDTGIRRMRVQIGTSVGGSEVMAPTEVFGLDPVSKVTIPSLTAGALYSISLLYTNNDGDERKVSAKYRHIPLSLDSGVELTVLGNEDAFPGENIQVLVRVRNHGSTTWTNSSALQLAPIFKANESGWETAPVTIPPGTTVAPGQSYTFNFTRPAPSTPGAYRCGWRLLAPSSKANPAWVGDPSPTRFLRVN